MDLTKKIHEFEQLRAGSSLEPAEPVTSSTPTPSVPVTGDGRVRPEINFAKYADRIFLPPQSKKRIGIRTEQWHPTLFDQEEDSHPSKLLIEPVEGQKTASTITYRTFLGLVRIWELRDKPADGKIVFSGRELASILKLKWGGYISQQFQREIKNLTGVRYTWEWAFADDRKNVLQLVEDMHILSGSAYLRKDIRLKEQKFEVLHRVQFHDLILKNLLAGRTKPVELETFLSISNGAAASLYMRLDLILADKTHYERRSAKLFEKDLALTSERYKKRYLRKAKLKELITQLDGKNISTGLLQLSLAETADQTDWKLVARKVPHRQKVIPAESTKPMSLINDLVSEIYNTVGQGDRMRLWESLARTYPENLIRQAVSEFRVDAPENLTHAGKFFTAIVHRLAHQRGLPWIKECGDNCKHRPTPAT